MNPRKLLAVAVLAALPTAGTAARYTQPTSPQTQASWVWVFDMDRTSTLEVGIAAAVACGMIAGPGGIACGVVGAF